MNSVGKVALVTGGTAGIGEAVLRRMAKLNVRTAFVGRDEERGNRIERELRSEGAEVIFLRADLGVAHEAREVVPLTVEKYGRLDYAFNNAGVSNGYISLAEESEEEFDRVFRINVKGMFLTLQQEIHQMLRQGQGGSIVNMASSTSILAAPGRSSYVASKHAVIGLTRSAALECGPDGIRVNAVCPGHVRTKMLEDIFEDETTLEELAKSHPLRRIGTPEEIADAVAWLFSDQSSYFTGQSLVLDGGFTSQRSALPPRRVSDMEQSVHLAHLISRA